jgi:hypothetical protein
MRFQFWSFVAISALGLSALGSCTKYEASGVDRFKPGILDSCGYEAVAPREASFEDVGRLLE